MPVPLTGSAAHPAMVVLPSSKEIVPVGVPEPGAFTLTVVVIVTDSPVTDGFTDDASDVEVAAGLTVCVTTEDVDPMKLGSPLEVTVIAWLPAPAYATSHDATPPTSGCAPQPVMAAPASRNAAVPVGVPLAGMTADTVAV
jgi:hypothetical protein